MGRSAIGVVGCGFFARFHLNAWRDLARDGAELVAVCDLDAAKAEAAGREFGVRWYTDASRMFATEKLDLVDIATRMETHLELVGHAIAARVPIVVQKPIAPGWDEAVAIVKAANDAGIFLAVHENFRFQAPFRQAARLIREGAIGSPTWARIAFRTGLDVYANQPYFLNEKRLVILDVGIHILDLARVLVGEVARISCETQRRNPRVRAEDTATMLLRHTNGAVTVAECTYENRRIPGSGIETLAEIEGPDGAIVIDVGCRLTVTASATAKTLEFNPPPLAWADPVLHVVQESVVQTCAHVLTALRAGRDADTSGADNLRTFALVEAAYSAAAERRAVEPAIWKQEDR